MRRRASFMIKVIHNLYDYVMYLCIALTVMCIVVYLAFLKINFDKAFEYLNVALYAGSPFIAIAMVVASLRWIIRRRLECTVCLKSYSKNKFRRAGGVCTYCEGKYFNYYKTHTEFAYTSVGPPTKTVATKNTYKGEDILRMIGE